MIKFKNKKILILSPNAWGDMHISKHHYARELCSRGNIVYFLNPPNKNNSFFSLLEVEKNLFIVNYYPIFRGYSIFPRAVFNFLIKLQIKFLLRRIKVRIDVLWSFTSNIFHRLDWFDIELTIFHPVDQLNSLEAIKIGEYADFIFTCSDYIVEELSALSKPIALIPHGISPSFTNYEFKPWKANDVFNICYVGNLFIENLDRDSLKLVIEKNPEHKFHFIGAIDPKESNISAWITEKSMEFMEFLMNSDNVICHGVVESGKIPDLISDMDAFLVCYSSDNNNVISNSHKILEYLITGRLIISTFVKHYNGSKLLEMMKENDDNLYWEFYSNKMNSISKLNSIFNQKERIDYAKKNSYSSHVDKIETIINTTKISNY